MGIHEVYSLKRNGRRIASFHEVAKRILYMTQCYDYIKFGNWEQRCILKELFVLDTHTNILQSVSSRRILLLTWFNSLSILVFLTTCFSTV